MTSAAYDLGEGLQLLLGQEGHGLHAGGQLLALLRVVELALFGEDEAVGLRVLDHLRGPDHAAARVVAAEDGHDHPVVGADVLEAAEDAARDVEDVALLEHDLARLCPSGPEEAPAALEDEEYLGRAVAVQRVAALGGWPAAPMLKPIASVMWTNWSGLSETPPPMIVKFSFWSEPGVWASMKAVLQGRSSP